MTNAFYNASGWPAPRARGESAAMRQELANIALGFEKLPPLTGNGGKIVRVNQAGTALESVAVAIPSVDSPSFTGTANFVNAQASGSIASNSGRILSSGSGATDARLHAVVQNVAEVAVGFNNSGVTNSFGMPSGAAYLATPQAIQLLLGVANKPQVKVGNGDMSPSTNAGTGLGLSSARWGAMYGTSMDLSSSAKASLFQGRNFGDWTGGSMSMQAANAGGGAAVMGFHREGVYAVLAGLDTDNRFKIGGWSDGGTFRMILSTTGASFPGAIDAAGGHFIVEASGDVRTSRGVNDEGVIFFGPSNSHYLYCTREGNYEMPTGALTISPATQNNVVMGLTTSVTDAFFPEANIKMAHYGLTWVDLPSTGGNRALCMSGYGGVVMYSSGTEQARVDNSGMKVRGLIYGHSGGIGLGAVTASTGGPSGGSDGDIHFRYI